MNWQKFCCKERKERNICFSCCIDLPKLGTFVINMLDIHQKIIDFDLDFLKKGKLCIFVTFKHKGTRKWNNIHSLNSFVLHYFMTIFEYNFPSNNYKVVVVPCVSPNISLILKKQLNYKGKQIFLWKHWWSKQT